MVIRVVIVFLSLIILACIVLGGISHCTPLFRHNTASSSTPYFFNSLSPHLGEITDYAVCENVIYILFEHKNILDCYGLDGSYMHSYFIDLGGKGKAELYVNNSRLFLKSRKTTFYVFEKGLFLESYDISTTDLYSEIQRLNGEKRAIGNNKYLLRGASVYCENEEGMLIVVSRPVWMTIFQGPGILIVGAICFLTICMLIRYKRSI